MADNFNIAGLFTAAAKLNPHKTAIIYKEYQISFTKLEKQVDDTAQYFLNKGIGKGDRVLVFVPMSIDLYRTILALFEIGAIAVFLDEWVNKQRMEECCKIARCKALIGVFKAKVFALFSTELKNIPIHLGTRYKANVKGQTISLTRSRDTALITFTTGTTGTPKAALRTHGFLYHQFKALEKNLVPENSDVSMAVLPIVLLINLATGTTSVIAEFNSRKPDKLKPEIIIKQLHRFKVNTIIASPFFVKKIAEQMVDKGIMIPLMKKIFTGGAPVFPSEAALYDRAFPNTKVEVVYGSTEAEPISTIAIKTLLKQKQSVLDGLNVGTIDESAEVKIIKITDGNISVNNEHQLLEITVPMSTVGEIIVSGNHVLSQYLNNEEALLRNKIFIGEKCWHRTGDSGYFGDDGNLYLMGRCGTLIEKNNKNVYPFVYENYFQSLEGVKMGTVLLLKDKITAIIEPVDKNRKRPVEAIINRDIPLIEQVIFFKKIPRDPRHNSKIDYQKLGLLLSASKIRRITKQVWY